MASNFIPVVTRTTAANHANETPPSGAPVYVTDTKRLYVGDGSTAGGAAVISDGYDAGEANVLDPQYAGGAPTDGTSDCTAAFVATAATGKVVVVPYIANGYTFADNALEISAARFAIRSNGIQELRPTLRGDGTKEGFGIRFTGGTTQVATVDGLDFQNFEAAIYQADTVLDGLDLRVTNCTTDGNKRGIWVVGNVTNLHVENSTLVDTSRTDNNSAVAICVGDLDGGTYPNQPGQVVIKNVVIDTVSAPGGYESHAVQTVGIQTHIDGLVMRDVTSSGTPNIDGCEGIYLKSGGSTLRNIWAYDCGNSKGAIVIKGVPGETTSVGAGKGCSLDTIHIEAVAAASCYFGVSIYTDGNHLNNITTKGLQRNTAEANKGAPIYIPSGDFSDNKITNCNFHDSGGRYGGVCSRTTGDGLEVKNCHVHNFLGNASESGESAAFYFQTTASATRWKVNGNTAQHNATPNYTGNSWGIRFVTTGVTLSDSEFNGNYVELYNSPAGTAHTAFDYGTGTWTGLKTISNRAAGTYDTQVANAQSTSIANDIFAEFNDWNTNVYGALTDAEVLTAWETATGRTASDDGTKLDNIEQWATADQSDSEIATAYDNQVSIISQAEAEAGVSATVRRWTSERVKQAIDALAPGTSLPAGVEPGATVADGRFKVTAQAVSGELIDFYNFSDEYVGRVATTSTDQMEYVIFDKTTTSVRAALTGEFGLVLAEYGTPPGTPAAGKVYIYPKASDSKLYMKNDAGEETDITGFGGEVGAVIDQPAYSLATANITGDPGAPAFGDETKLTLTATGDLTDDFDTPTGITAPADGTAKIVTLIVKQDGTGGRDLRVDTLFNNGTNWPNATVIGDHPVLTGAAAEEWQVDIEVWQSGATTYYNIYVGPERWLYDGTYTGTAFTMATAMTTGNGNIWNTIPRFTSASAKTFTITAADIPAEHFLNGKAPVVHFINKGAGDATVVQGTGMTLDGDLVFAEDKMGSIVFDSATTATVVGGTA
jgi:hypothetical protein